MLVRDEGARVGRAQVSVLCLEEEARLGLIRWDQVLVLALRASRSLGLSEQALLL
jgi:hypothetical protein